MSARAAGLARRMTRCAPCCAGQVQTRSLCAAPAAPGLRRLFPEQSPSSAPLNNKNYLEYASKKYSNVVSSGSGTRALAEGPSSPFPPSSSFSSSSSARGGGSEVAGQSDPYSPSATSLEELSLFKGGPKPGVKRFIDGYDEHSVAVNGVTYPGALIVLPRTVWLWENVNSLEDVTEESLSLLRLIDPAVRLVLIGAPESQVYGRARRDQRPGNWDVGRTLSTSPVWGRMGVEILSTRHACHTFNFLNQEDRDVAACLIPGA